MQDKRPTDTKGTPHGLWEIYWSNGQLHSRGVFNKGWKDGLWESYHENGDLRFKGAWVDRVKKGYWELNFLDYQPKRYRQQFYV